MKALNKDGMTSFDKNLRAGGWPSAYKHLWKALFSTPTTWVGGLSTAGSQLLITPAPGDQNKYINKYKKSRCLFNLACQG